MNLKALITLVVFGCQFCLGALFAQELDTLLLPLPDKTGGKPLMQALNERHSSRQFSSQELSLTQLSNLLWAANGINRPESGKRTAPTARNFQDMDVFVIMAKGIYRYEATKHVLLGIHQGDYRKVTGTQDFVQNAALNLVLVSDLAKMKDTNEETSMLYAGIHAGCIIQNIYLHCASEGLNTVTRASFDNQMLAKLLNLTGKQKVVMAQTVGFQP